MSRRSARRHPSSTSTATSRCSRVDDEDRDNLHGASRCSGPEYRWKTTARARRQYRRRRPPRQSVHRGHGRSQARARGTDRSRQPDPPRWHHRARRRSRARQAVFRRFDARCAAARRRSGRTVQRRSRSPALRVQVAQLHAASRRGRGRRRYRRRAAARAAPCEQPVAPEPRALRRRRADARPHAPARRHGRRDLLGRLLRALRRSRHQYRRARPYAVLRRRLFSRSGNRAAAPSTGTCAKARPRRPRRKSACIAARRSARSCATSTSFRTT